MSECLQTLGTRDDFLGADILDEAQFTIGGLDLVFQEADAARDCIDRNNKIDLLRGVIVMEHFETASTRTRVSYENGAKRLGAEVTVADNMNASSRSKGEKISHTARTYEMVGANLLVARTKETGDAQRMAEAVDIPVHNAGDGDGKHPTQAMLDVYTMFADSGGDLRGKTLTIVRDAKHGRTAHSVAPTAAMLGMDINVVAHPRLRLPQETVEACLEHGAKVHQTDDLVSVLEQTDYLYPTRMQKERYKGWREKRLYREANGLYVTSPDLLDSYGKLGVKVLHPLPADGELSDDMDDDPRALYWKQMVNGMYVRQALLALSLGESIMKYAQEHGLSKGAKEDTDVGVALAV